MSEKALVYQDTGAIVALVLDSLTSDESKRAYQRALDDPTWYAEQGRPALTKALVQRYKVVLEESGLFRPRP